MSKRTYPTVEHIQKTTLFKKKKQAEGALDTLMWLDEGAPHKFDGLKGYFKFAMEEFVTPLEETAYDNLHKCGTACCIAGAIYAHAHKLNGDDKNTPRNVDEYFGLDSWGGYDGDLYRLFYADHYSLEDITPKQAAKALRKYLVKGVVDWSHLQENFLDD